MNKENVAQHNFSLQARVHTPNSYSNGFIMHTAEGGTEKFKCKTLPGYFFRVYFIHFFNLIYFSALRWCGALLKLNLHVHIQEGSLPTALFSYFFQRFTT
jgi:hypothetical protein